jgi:hypothetical protein
MTTRRHLIVARYGLIGETEAEPLIADIYSDGSLDLTLDDGVVVTFDTGNARCLWNLLNAVHAGRRAA